jgi:hypothetical protein
MRRWFVGVAAAVLLVTGCGAVENERPDLANAVEQTRATESSRIEIRGQEEAEGNTVQITCTGAADYARKLLDISCEHDGEDNAFAMRAIAGAVYVRDGDTHGKWQRFPDDEDEPVSELSPERLLSMLRGASVETERVGEEAVRGAPAVRYRLRVSCEEAELTDCSGETAPVEVWIGEDDVVRRIWLEDAGFNGTIEFFDFGVAVDMQPPPANQVEDVDELPGARTCEPEGGTPIRASRAIEALRRAGFSVKRDRDACFAGLAAAIDNTGVPRVLEREGIVMCHLYDEPPATATGKVVRRGVDGGDAELVLANLECMIFTDRPDPEERIDPLEKAFAELERAIRR